MGSGRTSTGGSGGAESAGLKSSSEVPRIIFHISFDISHLVIEWSLVLRLRPLAFGLWPLMVLEI